MAANPSCECPYASQMLRSIRTIGKANANTAKEKPTRRTNNDGLIQVVRRGPLLKPDVPSLNRLIALNLQKPQQTHQKVASLALARNGLDVLCKAAGPRVGRTTAMK